MAYAHYDMSSSRSFTGSQCELHIFLHDIRHL